MKLSGILLIAIMMAVAAATTSCRDELCDNHFPSLAVSLSWEHEWERDYGMNHSASWDTSLYGFEYGALRPQKPEWVNCIHYSTDGSSYESFLKEDAGNVALDKEQEGQQVLLYNGDTEFLVLEDMASFTDARATPTTRTRNTGEYLNTQHPGLSTTNPPDILYSAFVDNIKSAGPHTQITFPVTMQPLVFTYLIRYEFEYGIHHVSQARGALGGMAESVYLRDGHTSDKATIILYDCDVKDYGCEARVRSFGVPSFSDEYYGRGDDSRAIADRPFTLNLELLLTNGTTLEFNYNISNQIANQPKGGVITISGIRVEDEQNKVGESAGAFDVDLSGWGNIEQDLPFDVNNGKDVDSDKQTDNNE